MGGGLVGSTFPGIGLLKLQLKSNGAIAYFREFLYALPSSNIYYLFGNRFLVLPVLFLALT